MDTRFEFGKNWKRFLKSIDAERVDLAKNSLRSMLGFSSLAGKSFIDVGSGSGLFSLAARQLGASVRSFDYDLQAVACTESLRRQYFNNDQDWIIEPGSILDKDYIENLGSYDIVYSWGVLHHTGAMWDALEKVSCLVKNNGLLLIAIYNDQGTWSGRWRRLKLIYNKLPVTLRWPYMLLIMSVAEFRPFMTSILRLQLLTYIRGWTRYASLSGRGMSRWRDAVDWMGGYPFEVAKPEEIFRFYRDKGFRLVELRTCGSSGGCNQYTFVRDADTFMARSMSQAHVSADSRLAS